MPLFLYKCEKYYRNSETQVSTRLKSSSDVELEEVSAFGVVIFVGETKGCTEWEMIGYGTLGKP